MSLQMDPKSYHPLEIAAYESGTGAGVKYCPLSRTMGVFRRFRFHFLRMERASFPMQAVMCACGMQIILHSFCKPPHSTTRPPSFRLPSHRTANELFVPQPLKYLYWMPLPDNVYPPSRIRNPFVPSLIPCFMMPSVSIDSDLL